MQTKEVLEIAKALVEAAGPIIDALDKFFGKVGDSDTAKN